jgi:SAD/SRA domain
MDAGVQAGYVHAMLKTRLAAIQDGKRMAIIFRNGVVKPQVEDNGKAIENLDPRPITIEYIHGGMPNVLEEGSRYSRDDIFNLRAHQNATGNIDGNKTVGCPSVVVCFMSGEWDVDDFQYLTYQTGNHSRHHAMLRSFCEQNPIRVFRCSKGNKEKGKYFPDPFPKNKVAYRYDGLYYIIAVKNRNGEEVERSMASRDARVFFLLRAEPIRQMAILWKKHPSARAYLPCKANGTSQFSARKAEDLHSMVEPWNFETFDAWNPKHRS